MEKYGNSEVRLHTYHMETVGSCCGWKYQCTLCQEGHVILIFLKGGEGGGLKIYFPMASLTCIQISLAATVNRLVQVVFLRVAYKMCMMISFIVRSQ